MLGRPALALFRIHDFPLNHAEIKFTDALHEMIVVIQDYLLDDMIVHVVVLRGGSLAGIPYMAHVERLSGRPYTGLVMCTGFNVMIFYLTEQLVSTKTGGWKFKTLLETEQRALRVDEIYHLRGADMFGNQSIAVVC